MTIGIPGWLTGPNSFGVTISYLEFIREIGATDIRVLHPDSPIFKDLDLLILPGGPDINPVRYNAQPSLYTDKPDPIREWFDVRKLPKYIELNIPIFGICRGFCGSL